jgi:hypothetical protein
MAVDVRRRGEHAAALTTAEDLAAEVDTALTELRESVLVQPADRIVNLGAWGLRIDDDLAVSLGLPTPPTPAAASEATIQLPGRLTGLAARSLAVIRALARQKRAPASIGAL